MSNPVTLEDVRRVLKTGAMSGKEIAIALGADTLRASALSDLLLDALLHGRLLCTWDGKICLRKE
jgi:hypothetical protein